MHGSKECTVLRISMGCSGFATGVPMIVAGDEFGRSQGGNNNAYCLDDDTSWIDWNLEPWQHDLRETVAYLLALRREHPVLRQDRFFAGRPVHPGLVRSAARGCLPHTPSACP